MRIVTIVDGRDCTWDGPADARLLDVLRDGLGVVAPREGCRIGRCGACAVLLDGEAVPSCLVLAARVDGAEVQTADGLGTDGETILRVLAESGAVQCGYCTAGIMVALAGALRESPRPAPDAVLDALAGQLCRCGGYEGLRRAVGTLFG